MNTSKRKMFAVLVALENERRSMTTETKSNRFMLSEIRYRCKRARERAFLMLRYCRHYDNAPGEPVLAQRPAHRPVPKTNEPQAARKTAKTHAGTHATAAPTNSDNFNRKHCHLLKIATLSCYKVLVLYSLWTIK